VRPAARGPRTRRAALALASLASTLGTPARAAAQPPAPRVRSGVSVTPDTVTVGDPFVVQVRVAAPAGATVEFPAAPDSAGPVDLLDPKRESAARAADGGVDVTATYRAAAWDVGTLPLGLGDVVVRAGGAERRIPLGAVQVTVRSVLPADSAQRVAKPVRPPVPDAGPWWIRLALLAAAALAAVALLLWLARRWWRGRRRVEAGDAAFATAVAAFDALDRLRLVVAGEGGRHVALASDIARDYLAARIAAADRAHTSGELLAALRADPDVPHARLASLLAAADLVKFAGVELGASEAAAVGREARLVVDETERAVRERAAQAAAEAAERERAARDARRRYEEERRRAARASGPAAPPPDDAPGRPPDRAPRDRERAA
jgi:hypothetical protein